MSNAIHPPPAGSANTHANTQRQAYNAPTLTAFGSVAKVTAGGSKPNGSEFWRWSCDSQSVFIRC